MRFLSNILLFAAIFSLFSACSNTNSDILPDNEIRSTNGLTIELEWTTGSSTQQAVQEVDLDLFAYFGFNEGAELVEGSTNKFGFEQLTLRNFYADGSYFIDVDYFAGILDRVDFEVYLSSNSNDEVQVYLGRIGEGSSFRNFLEIRKQGDLYTILN